MDRIGQSRRHQITAIAADASLTLNDSDSGIADSGNTTGNSALAGLARIAGNLTLNAGTISIGGDLHNAGGIQVSGALSIGGTLTNANAGGGAHLTVGAPASGLAEVTAAGLANNSDITVQGNTSGGQALLAVSGDALNAGSIVADAGGEVTIGGALTNNGTLLADNGTITVSGAVAGGGGAAVVDGGAIAFLGASDAKLTFLAGASGEIQLADPSRFTGTIAGFAVGRSTTTPGDKIDLTTIADSAISGATLDPATDRLNVTLSGGGGFTLQLTGTYSTISPTAPAAIFSSAVHRCRATSTPTPTPTSCGAMTTARWRSGR